MKHTAFYISNTDDNNDLLAQIISGELIPEMKDLKGAVYSDIIIDKFLTEEKRHGRFDIATETKNSLQHSSSGEQKKALLTHVISQKPAYIIVDNIFESFEEDLIQSFSKHEVPYLIVQNKIDVCQRLPQCSDGKYGKEILISASQGLGLDILRQQITRYAGLQDVTEGNFMARRRHVNALENAETAIKTGLTQLVEHQAGELLAAELQQAQQHLGLITGEYTSDDLLGNIFSSFCIGK